MYVCMSLCLQNRPLITRVVLLLASGLSTQLWCTHQAQLPHLAALGRPVEVIGLNPCARPGALQRSSVGVLLGGVGARACS